MKRGVGRARVWGRKREREKDFKELTSMIVEAWQVQNRQHRPAGWRSKEELQRRVQMWSVGRIPSPEEVSLPIKTFIWLDEAIHAMKGNLLYSKSTDLNIHFI